MSRAVAARTRGASRGMVVRMDAPASVGDGAAACVSSWLLAQGGRPSILRTVGCRRSLGEPALRRLPPARAAPSLDGSRAVSKI